MKKPKRPKSTPPRPHKPLVAPIPREHQPTLLSQVLKTWWGKAGAVLAALGGVQSPFSTYDFFRSLYEDTNPEIHISAVDPNPFAVPFRIKNNSHFFPMKSVEWFCGINDVLTPQGGGLFNFSITYKTNPITIEPTRDVTFRCPIKTGPNVSANVQPILKYKTLWFDRIYNSREFIWYRDATPPKWIETDAPAG